ncbi:MAG: quinone-dependent dihydroorotate dehydrogenase [bacterium]
MKKVFHATSRFIYKNLAKPLFFRRDPEDVHDSMTHLGEFLGRFSVTRFFTRLAFHIEDPSLVQNIRGLEFKNPVGLAAGFDKDAHLLNILPDVGFGFMEAGSVTGKTCAGNPKPRLWRLKDQQSLVVWYGLKNEGAANVAVRLHAVSHRFPVGVSIAKTNCAETAEDEAAIADYGAALEAVKDTADYITINISCPNAFGGQPFNDAPRLEKLLTALENVSLRPTAYGPRPIFIKLSPDLTFEQLDSLIDVAARHRIQGLISSNLTKTYEAVPEALRPTHGGLSGKLVEEKANAQLSHLYKKYGSRFTLVGCGGIFSAEDAYLKIRAGASLLQLITGMIFEGPQLVGEINAGLIELLKRDGFKNISEAIGADNKLKP